jgi:hypothetical protein
MAFGSWRRAIVQMTPARVVLLTIAVYLPRFGTNLARSRAARRGAALFLYGNQAVIPLLQNLTCLSLITDL